MNRFTRSHLLLYAVHIVLALLVLLPLAFAFVSSFRPLEDIYKYMSPITWKTFWPSNFTWGAYQMLFTERGFGQIFLNTFFVGAANVIGGLLLGSMAAFAFVYFEFRGKTLLFLLVLLTFMIPFEVISIPLYSLVNSLGWVDTYAGIIIPGIANGLVIFLFRQFFLELPTSLVESARMDGASWLRVYTRIVMPLCKPVTVSASLLIFIQQWESFLWPLIVTRSKEYKVIQVALSDFVTEYATYWNEMFAAVILSILLPVVLLLPLQRYYVQGIANTGSKE
ncbi:binding-protein-dependent transport systems inner membrane component [Paenibacillus terrae HPL-003]|uniref:Binding-protein-dependent transport systems inner membrane component n=1 Tax=Paenibacillus terrae (strain HPL-003) TaxID=985665 RepID=G7W136_PAETH|nr:carbohydrate ABC transporter permease [Paenibacillus terrae]AET60525.1 binding-protein-dependent transport systems inner membrane component [Paenibacillus terrae HPL-003]